MKIGLYLPMAQDVKINGFVWSNKMEIDTLTFIHPTRGDFRLFLYNWIEQKHFISWLQQNVLILLGVQKGMANILT